MAMAQLARTGRGSADNGGPVRQCALTRERRAQGDLIRFVLDPEGRVVPDLKNKLPGRGVWLSVSCDAVAAAAKKGVFARGFASRVKAGPELADQVGALLEKASLERLALANKAGLVTTGFEKVAEAIARKEAAVLLHAADGAAGGREKLDGKIRGQSRPAVAVFTSGQLSLALGRSNVVHAAVSKGGAAESFLDAVDRLEQYRSPGAVGKAAPRPVTDTV